MLAAFGLITLNNQDNQHQTILGSLINRSIRKTAASAIAETTKLSEINDAMAFPGMWEEPRSSTLNLVQDNSIVSRGTIVTDLVDDLSDRSTEVSDYEVQDGDTVSFIASDFGLTVNTILWANNLKNADQIKPGMILKIPPVDGVVHTIQRNDTIEGIANRYSVKAGEITAYNLISSDEVLVIGKTLIIPGGIMKAKVNPGIKSNTVSKFAYLQDLGDFFLVPAVGFNWGKIHGRNGVDVANNCGSSVKAAADGTVTVAASSGYHGGFGKYIKIIHANGTETLYAHLSKLEVSVGDVVAKGQQIALMGTTGRSTGCHLHFEVHGARNPLAKL